MPPIEYTTTNYPDRAENAQPDEDVGQHPSEGNEPVPGTVDDAASTPAGEYRDVVTPFFRILVAAVVGHRQYNGIGSL